MNAFLDEAVACESAAKDFLRRQVLTTHAPFRWEHVRAGQIFDGVAEVRNQWRSDRNGVRVPALRCVAVVRPTNRENALFEVHVAFVEPEQFPLA